ncbi:expressed unknown protein [Seminavis robusta]|uniref:Helitron helicase-like domain-containing protein n=1 Tax=Seminavis robusta TaxID=568900 RepID=A0A9N8EZ74_9STRA|nr:expressed unknown protein [Seminavis robusta]|eukprot:Sro2191_g318340.1 n/a (743) ;mRNA; f:4129-6357
MSEITKELNQAIDSVLHFDEVTKTASGKVCVICDRLLKRKETRKIGLTTFLKKTKFFKGDNSLPPSLRAGYRFTVPNNAEANATLSGCLLSPRSKVVFGGKTANRRRSPHVLCCKDCGPGLTNKKLQSGELPRFAIANGMAIGTAPPCLKRLNEIELALLSQARFRGHLFAVWGGSHRSIKGWHSFYEVDPAHTTSVLQAVKQFTDSNNIAVVLSGPFTPEQRERVLKKMHVNVEWVTEAFHWLKENNRLYHDLELPTIANPTVIDNSYNVESENSDIEIKEEMKVIFPDATIRTAGCADASEFDRAIAEIRSKCAGALPYLTSRPSSKLLRDYEDENLMRAFPLQFPYGFSFHDDFNIKASQNGYLSHLISLSIPSMHEACFVLVVHNMFERCKALNGALRQVMGGREKCDVSEEDLNAAIACKLNGLPVVNGPGSRFLDSVHSVKKQMAHTNGAAAAAQSKFLTLTHHYGCPKVLFTVSFDDSLDIRILVWSEEEDSLNWIASMDSMSPEEVAIEMDKCNAIRYKYPGLCAWNFEELMDVVLESIVGDNALKLGVFGTLLAYGLAVEEQGRNTLHGHILVYTTDWNDTLRDLSSSHDQVRKAAGKKVLSFVDRVISTELVPNAPWQEVYCPTCNKGLLTYVDEQKLRNLRHKVGCQVEKGIIASYPLCKACFQGDELAMKRVLPKELWNVPEPERKAQVALDVLRNTTPTAEAIPSEQAIAHAFLLKRPLLSTTTSTTIT